jgi:hypothetical protein
MSETKKTAADYRKELNNLQEKKDALSARIAERLYCLCERFPNAEIGSNCGHTIIKAKSIGNKVYIDRINNYDRLEFLEAIEKWIADQNPVKQTRIKFE